MSVSVGNSRHDWLPNLLLLRAYLAFGHQVTTQTAFLSLQQKSQSMRTILPDRRQSVIRVLWIFLSRDPTHRKNFVSSHSHASYFTDLSDVKNSGIRIERDYLKHLKRKFGVAVTTFILITKLNGFKYPITITSDLNHSSSLYT